MFPYHRTKWFHEKKPLNREEELYLHLESSKATEVVYAEIPQILDQCYRPRSL